VQGQSLEWAWEAGAVSAHCGDLQAVTNHRVEALALSRLRHGASSAAAATAHYNLADAYLRRRLAEQAAEHGASAWQAAANSEEENPAELRELQSRAALLVGAAYMLQREWPSAAKWMRRSLAATEEWEGKDSHLCVEPHLGLASLARVRGDEADALPHLVRAWEVKEHHCRAVGPDGDDVELADIYMELRRSYENLGDVTAALDMVTRACRIYRRHLGEHCAQGARASLAAGRIQNRRDHGTAALEHYNRACFGLSRSLGRQNKEAIQAAQERIDLLRSMDRSHEAEQQLGKLLAACRGSPMAVGVLKKLKQLYLDERRWAETSTVQEAITVLIAHQEGCKSREARKAAVHEQQVRSDMQRRVEEEPRYFEGLGLIYEAKTLLAAVEVGDLSGKHAHDHHHKGSAGKRPRRLLDALRKYNAALEIAETLAAPGTLFAIIEAGKARIGEDLAHGNAVLAGDAAEAVEAGESLLPEDSFRFDSLQERSVLTQRVAGQDGLDGHSKRGPPPPVKTPTATHRPHTAEAERRLTAAEEAFARAEGLLADLLADPGSPEAALALLPYCLIE